jgi:hypothetical protein
MQNTQTPGSHAVTGGTGLRPRWLYNLGGGAALILLGLFVIGTTAIIATIAGVPATGGSFGLLQRNWLVVLFQVNVPASGVGHDALALLNPLDLTIMVLFAVMAWSLYPALRRTGRVWVLVAVALPVLAVPLFLATGTAGRSSLLVSGLMISVAMLRSDRFSRPDGYIGTVAGLLLFVGGDIATTVFHSSEAIAALIGVAYVLWVIWLGLIALGLFQLGHGAAR